MSDELNGQLLRLFADSHRPLADAQFVAQVGARLRPGTADVLGTLRSAFRTARAGLTIGMAALWRQPYMRLMALAAAALSVWSAFA